ncbi:helix-turn-helix transcriptional regulator [Streptomyces sp. NBC_01498]|uniref:helix-turn-helix transcriptional regulator n=1 Tax=Streptomyces sp. NBC_01498 TaxID=2975870 RepID=UPI002E7ABD3C|nr:helix-turn-helix transcriptional regulator [Streptomyces sp. NBC_01498]WTL25145.1 helix-turn-helix transcriptional regulator [Streptomyces sp. NBC_01498]
MDDLIRHPLAYARQLRGWSQSELARQMRDAARRRGLRAGTSRQRVSVWERRVVPDAFSQALLGDVFDVPREQITALGWPHWLPGHEIPVALGAGLAVVVLRKALLMGVDRRTFLALAPAAVGSLALQWATVEPAWAAGATGGRAVDPAFVDRLEESARALTGMPTALRQHAGPLLDGHLETVVGLLERGGHPRALGVRLHTLASALAQTVAWHRFDHERHAAAHRHWHAAVHSAHEAGNTDLGAGALADLAYQSIWLGRPRAAVDCLGHALSRTVSPTARSLLLLRKARAHAMLGEARDCYRALARSEKLLHSTAEPAPGWCAWMSHADLAVDTGRCLIDLGRPRRAHDHITEGVGLLPDTRDKTKAVFLAYEAESLLARGEVQQAADLARRSLGLATRIGASRCVRQIRDLSGTFAAYGSEDGVGLLRHEVLQLFPQDIAMAT